MPPKSKRKLILAKNCMKARETKASRTSDVGTSGTAASAESTDEETSLVQLAEMTEDAIDTDDEAVDPSFDMNDSIKSGTDHVFETFCEDWVCQLGRYDKVFLGLFLSFQLTQHFGAQCKQSGRTCRDDDCQVRQNCQRMEKLFC